MVKFEVKNANKLRKRKKQKQAVPLQGIKNALGLIGGGEGL